MDQRRISSVARALVGSIAGRGIVVGGILAGRLADVLAQDRPEVGAVIDPGPIANNGQTMVSMVDGVPVIEEVRQRGGGGRGNGGGGQDGGGGGDGGGAADASGGAGNLAFVS